MEQYQTINNKYFYIGGLTDQGNRKENQDCFLIEEHPIIKNTVLAVVLDGVGGEVGGKLASDYTKYLLRDSFFNSETFDPSIISKIIRDIHYKVINNTGGYTTISLVISNPIYTYMTNIGDSRIYSYNHKLEQLTDDDSLVWAYIKNNKLSIDDLRYLCRNNLITRCIGDYKLSNIDVQKIKTPKELLLTTDGVHDVLSYDMLNNILKNYNEEDIIPKIILDSLTVSETIEDEVSDYLLYNTLEPFNARTYPGKDNTTAVLVKKKRPL